MNAHQNDLQKRVLTLEALLTGTGDTVVTKLFKKLFEISWYVNNNHVGFLFACFSVSLFFPAVSYLILEKNTFWVCLQIARLPPVPPFFEHLSKKWLYGVNSDELCNFPNQIIPFNNTILYHCLSIEMLTDLHGW